MSRATGSKSHPSSNPPGNGDFGNILQNRLSAVAAYFDRPTLIALVVGSLALFGAILAPRIADSQTLTILFFVLFFGLIGAYFLLRWPILGIAGIIVASLAVPFSLSTGSATGVNAGVLLLIVMLGLWFFDMLARKKEIRLISMRVINAALVFCVISVIAFGFGQISWFQTQGAPVGAQVAGLMIFLLSAGAFLLVAHQVKSKKELEWITWVFLGVGSLYLIGRMIPFVNQNIYNIFVREATLGALFYIWFVSMALSQALFNRDLSKKWRIFLGGMILIFLYLNVGISRFWLSGWLPPFAAACFILLLAKPRLGIGLMVLGVIYLLIDSQIVSDITSGGDNEFSRLTRLVAWQIIAEMVKVNPIFGLGMANYYYYTPLYSILGYNVQFNSHNNYVDIIAQAGLVGLLAFTWFLWEIFRLGMKMRGRVSPGFSQAFVYGVLGGFAGSVLAGMFGDWLIPFFYNIGLEGFRASVIGWMFMGGLVALYQIEKNRIESGAEISTD
jgi:O-antigen ligase